MDPNLAGAARFTVATALIVAGVSLVGTAIDSGGGASVAAGVVLLSAGIVTAAFAADARKKQTDRNARIEALALDEELRATEAEVEQVRASLAASRHYLGVSESYDESDVRTVVLRAQVGAEEARIASLEARIERIRLLRR